MNRLRVVRIAGVAVVCVLSMGALVAGVLVSAAEGTRALSQLRTIDGWLELATIAFWASCIPAGIGAVVGAVIAVRTVKASARHQSLRAWLRAGFLYGLVAGACVAAAYFVAFGARTWETLPVLAIMTPTGAIAGGMSGILLGCYCHCETRRQRTAS